MTKTKVCIVCGIEKDHSEFSFKKNRKGTVKYPGSYCRSCKSIKDKKRRKLYQNELRDKEYKKRYGIGIKDYDEMLELQEGKCAICQSVDVGNKKSKYFFVDHDHNTGKVRGLLCHPCNISIGNLKDDPDIVYNAWMYLCFDQGKVELFDENNKRLDIT